jgi:hypothetical protein
MRTRSRRRGVIKLQCAFDSSIKILYETDAMADESVLISLQHKKRKGRVLAVVQSRSVTVRGLPLDEVFDRLKKTFQDELEGTDVGLYERPEEQVLAQLQHYTRDPAGGTLKYSSSKSLTVPNVALTAALRRIKTAFSRPKK